jgi:cell division protein FtsI/penicillin-binding protein 2
VTGSLARLRALFAIFAIASLVLAGRLAYWQTVGRGELLGQATDQIRSDLILPALRGVVRDRSGAILTTTVELRSLYAIPRRIADHAAAAALLAPILHEDAATIRAALDSGAEWLYLRRRLPEDVAQRIDALRVEGLGFENEPKRLYPNGALGAHVLGFVNDDGQGQYGIEGRYDTVLRGVDGRLVVERDPANRELAIGLRIATDPQRGQDLTLTLDLAVQTSVERALAAAISRERATSGSAVVLDPRDGAILALASWPT